MFMYVNSRLFCYISQISSSGMGKECLQPSHVISSQMSNIYVGYMYYYLMNINLMVTGIHFRSLVHFPDVIKKLEEVPFLSWNMVPFLVSNTVCSS
jgi:hypothetical protein